MESAAEATVKETVATAGLTTKAVQNSDNSLSTTLTNITHKQAQQLRSV